MIRDLPVHGEKPLRVQNRLEALHPSLALTNRSMRVLSPIVQSLPTMMSHIGHYIPFFADTYLGSLSVRLHAASIDDT